MPRDTARNDGLENVRLESDRPKSDRPKRETVERDGEESFRNERESFGERTTEYQAQGNDCRHRDCKIVKVLDCGPHLVSFRHRSTALHHNHTLSLSNVALPNPRSRGQRTLAGCPVVILAGGQDMADTGMWTVRNSLAKPCIESELFHIHSCFRLRYCFNNM